MPFFVSNREFESEISKRVAEACEQIIAQIGAELHDELMQKLTSLRYDVPRIERSCSDDAAMVKMKTDLEQMASTTRTITRRLLPVQKEGEPLVQLLDNVCRNLERPGLSHIHLTTEGQSATVAAHIEMHIVRIVQELIHNAIKHSSAWHIWLRLKWQPEMLCIEVEDDGVSFNHERDIIKQLKNKNNTLKMRSQAIGASLDYAQGKKGLMARLELSIKP